ncbi:DNA repair protein RecN [Alloiococcus sp. CFN-8]|uniref:DNA repair protein RecN n=1 Tax=Alloiococcus sp. CFN-8 TaxID=3416081 RepID=UPI003CED4333
MLLQISIKNFALIDNITISFYEGFNVLSGETGAGKSILIDAINFVMGNKFNKDLIRTGEDKTYVEAVFSVENSKTAEILKELNIDEDNIVILSRETFQNGRSISKINGKSAVLSSLKEISKSLIDIHGQHENQNLLEINNHLMYLDSFAQDTIYNELEKYRNIFEKYQNVRTKIQRLKGNDDVQNNINFLKFQIEDIDNGKLESGEEEQLNNEYKVLSHAEKINYSVNSAYSSLKEFGEGSSAYDLIYSASKDLASIEKHMEQIKNINRALTEVSYNLEEIINDLRNLKETVVYDEEAMGKINTRLYEIANYKKKYNRSVEDILSYREELENQYEELVNSEEIIRELELEESLLKTELDSVAEKLHNIRQSAAQVLESKVMYEFQDIGLEKSTFKVEVLMQDSYMNNGKDKVQFLISTNPGEPMKSMERIVSGGELSRIMLALKTVFVDKDATPSIIFDEIDTGISGRVAQSVAEKMYKISAKHQVLCVTHLPQIAAMSDVNFLVAKDVVNEKTYTSISSLKADEKTKEIARMIGGVEITKVTLDNAEEMIRLAENKKSTLINKIE